MSNSEKLIWTFETDGEVASWFGKASDQDGPSWRIELSWDGIFRLTEEDLSGWVEDGYEFKTLKEAQETCEYAEGLKQKSDRMEYLKLEYPGVPMHRHFALGRIRKSMVQA